MFKRAFTYAACLAMLCALFTGCQVNPVTGEKQFRLVSAEQELKMGHGYHPDLVFMYDGEYQDPELKRYLGTIVQRLHKVSHRAEMPMDFTVLNTTMLNVHAVKRCIDYLVTLSFVEAKKIAVMGHSFGGYMATMATAVLPRISAAVISGFMCEIDSYYGRSWTCGSQVIPGLFSYGDLSDIACLFPPCPLLIITGLYDCVTPSVFGISAFRKIKSAYRITGHAGKVVQHTFPGDHIFQPENAIPWLANLWSD